jgi:hypothetical protein
MHPKVEEAYRNARFPIPTTADSVADKGFERLLKRTRDENVSREITQVYRIRPYRNKDDEFIVYDEKVTLPNYDGTPKSFIHRRGVYDLPIITNINDSRTEEPAQIMIARHERRYDEPFSKSRIQEILNSGDSKNTNFVLQIGDGISQSAIKLGGFTIEDFTNKSFNQLHAKALSWDEETLAKAEAERSGEIEVERVQAAGATRKQAEEEETGEFSEEETQQRRREARETLQRLKADKTVVVASPSSSGNKKGPNDTEAVAEQVNYVIRREDMEEAPAQDQSEENNDEEPIQSDKMGEQGKPRKDGQGPGRAIDISERALEEGSGSAISEERLRKSQRKK